MIRQGINYVALSIASQKETLIANAIIHKIGTDWKLEDIIGRAELLVYQNEVEMFCFDGEALLEFYPYEVEITERHIKADLPHKILYK